MGDQPAIEGSHGFDDHYVGLTRCPAFAPRGPATTEDELEGFFVCTMVGKRPNQVHVLFRTRREGTGDADHVGTPPFLFTPKDGMWNVCAQESHRVSPTDKNHPRQKGRDIMLIPLGTSNQCLSPTQRSALQVLKVVSGAGVLDGLCDAMLVCNTDLTGKVSVLQFAKKSHQYGSIDQYVIRIHREEMIHHALKGWFASVQDGLEQHVDQHVVVILFAMRPKPFEKNLEFVPYGMKGMLWVMIVQVFSKIGRTDTSMSAIGQRGIQSALSAMAFDCGWVNVHNPCSCIGRHKRSFQSK
ncbi:MAG: hypothetical protein OXT73_04190 [Bacteroidota bacterium]|nr:hypothetical protein [Bacteroidota bacterium]